MEQVFPALYKQLHRSAKFLLRSEKSEHTLQPTALLNEAYLKLVQQHDMTFQDRDHFCAFAARLMRRILVDYAREKKAKKRSGSQERSHLELDQVILPERQITLEQVLDLDQALKQLHEMDERKGQIVTLRFFGGLELPEISQLLECSLSTVNRDWRAARAWLLTHLEHTSENF